MRLCTSTNIKWSWTCQVAYMIHFGSIHQVAHFRLHFLASQYSIPVGSRLSVSSSSPFLNAAFIYEYRDQPSLNLAITGAPLEYLGSIKQFSQRAKSVTQTSSTWPWDEITTQCKQRIKIFAMSWFSGWPSMTDRLVCHLSTSPSSEPSQLAWIIFIGISYWDERLPVV
jgi:hypothetical protein